MTSPTAIRGKCRRCFASFAPGACADLCPACLAELALFDEPEPESESPDRIGDYELLDELGRGGMGVVWRARQRSLNRIVALKTLTTRLPGEDATRRFQREAEAAAALRHPHIVAVYEVGESEGRWYLSMELVEGGSLASRIKREALPPRDSAVVLAKVARAVQHAHERGVLHRDIKPGNILLDDSGEPRVADFGLARIDGMEATLTQTGSVLGTPAYMSPEQAAGHSRDLTTASDVYSLGAVFYELLTGQTPFTAETSVRVLRRVAEEEPPRPTSIKRELDSDLETICLRCLEKEPTARYRSMLALAGDLERWLKGEPILARRVTAPERVWKWARRHPALAALWSVVAVLFLTVAIVATALSFSLSRYNKTVIASAETLRHQLARELAGSSQRLVEADDWLRALPPLAEAIRLGTGNDLLDRANRVRFSTLVQSSPELRYVWADGRKIVRVESDANGRYLLLVTPQSADLWDLEPRPVLKHRWNATGEWRSGSISNDGSRLLLATLQNRYSLIDSETGATLSEGDGAISSPSAFGAGGRLFITFNEKTAQVHSSATGEATSPPMEHAASIEWAAQVPWKRFSLTQDTDGQLYLWKSPLGALVTPPFKLGEKGVALAAFAENDRTVALQGRREIYLIQAFTGDDQGSFKADGGVQTIGMDAGQQWLYLARRDTGVQVRELRDDRLRFSPVHGALGFRGAFASKSDLLATQSWDGSARVWKLSNGHPESPLLWQAATPGDCLLDREGRWLLTRSDEPAIRLWALRKEGGGRVMDGIAYSPVSAWFEGSPERMRMAEQSGRVHAFDARTGKILGFPLDHGESILTAGPCAAGRRIFTCGESRAQIWDADTGGLVGTPFESESPMAYAAVDPKGERIAAVVKQVGVVVWDPLSAAEICRISGDAVRAEFSPDGSALLVTRGDGAQVFDATTGAAASSFVIEPDKLTEARFSPDGKRVLQWSRTTRAGQNAARIWNASTSAIETTLEPHWRAIDDAAFSPDGNLVASGGEDHILRICDAHTGQRVHPPRTHRNQVRKVGFSPDGSFVWAVSNNDVHIWDTAAAEAVGPRLSHAKDPVAFAWSGDSQRFVTIGDSLQPRVWSFVPDNRSPEELEIVARALSSHALSSKTSDLGAVDLSQLKEAWARLGLDR